MMMTITTTMRTRTSTTLSIKTMTTTTTTTKTKGGGWRGGGLREALGSVGDKKQSRWRVGRGVGHFESLLLMWMVSKCVGNGCRMDVIHWVRPRWGTNIFFYKNRLGGLHSKFTIFCVYITLFFKFIRAKIIYITFFIKERLSWGSSRKFIIEWVITALFEVTEYSQNRS